MSNEMNNQTSLDWKDVEGELAVRRAFNNGYTYIYWWGYIRNCHYVDIYKGEYEYSEVKLSHIKKEDWASSGRDNYGEEDVYSYADSHAKINRFPWIAKLWSIFK